MLLVIFLKDLYHKKSQISGFIMEIKNGIIIDGVLHEMSKTFNEKFDCSECSFCKECKECKMEHESYLCNVMGCFCFVNRGKVTDIKTEEEKK